MTTKYDDILARLNAATQGEWLHDEMYQGHHVIRFRPYHGTAGNIYNLALLQGPSSSKAKADGDFIANAPSDIAALLAEVERLTIENTRLRNHAAVDLIEHRQDACAHAGRCACQSCDKMEADHA